MTIKLTKRSVILLVCIVLLLVASIVLSMLKKHNAATEPDPAPTSQQTAPDKDVPKVSELVLGDWYSTREKGDHLVIKADGTFTSDWLGNGTYSIEDNSLKLVGPLNLNAELTFDKNRDILSYVPAMSTEESHDYYRTEELMKKSISDAVEADRTSDAAVTGKELLTSGKWYYRNEKTIFNSFVFTDNTITFTTSVEDKTHIQKHEFEYVLERAVVDESGNGTMVVYISAVDKSDKTGKVQSAALTIKNMGDGVYILNTHDLGESGTGKYILDKEG